MINSVNLTSKSAFHSPIMSHNAFLNFLSLVLSDFNREVLIWKTENFSILLCPFQREFNDLLTKLQEKIHQASNMMRCDNCGGKHKRVPIERPWYSARFCDRCKIRHSAKEVSRLSERSIGPLGLVSRDPWFHILSWTLLILSSKKLSLYWFTLSGCKCVYL